MRGAFCARERAWRRCWSLVGLCWAVVGCAAFRPPSTPGGLLWYRGSSGSILRMSSPAGGKGEPQRQPRKVRKVEAPGNDKSALGFPPLSDPFPPLRMKNYRLRQGEVLVRFINLPTPEGADDGQQKQQQQVTEVMETARQGESLMAVANRVGVRIPTSCRSGICGTCTMDLEDPNWQQYGSYRPGYVPFKTCVAKVAVPAGHYEMVVDVYRMRRGSGRVPGDIKSMSVTELGDAMSRFEEGWEEDYKGNKLPRPDFIGSGRVVRKLGSDDGKAAQEKSLEYFEIRKRDRDIQRLMKERLALGARKEAVGSNVELEPLVHDEWDPEVMPFYVSDSFGMGAARNLGYMRGKFPKPQERHPLKETRPRELARTRQRNPPSSTQYPNTEYFERDLRWDIGQPNLQDPYLRALTRPIPKVPKVKSLPRGGRPPADIYELLGEFTPSNDSGRRRGVDGVLDLAAGRKSSGLSSGPRRRRQPELQGASCYKCQGGGRLSCAVCQGEGYRYDIDSRGAQMRVGCSACSEYGGMQCDECRGSGMLRR